MKKSVGLSDARSEAVRLAKEHVVQAAVLLRQLGPDEARVSWLLEDALVYLDDPGLKDESGEDPFEKFDVPQDFARKKANAK